MKELNRYAVSLLFHRIEGYTVNNKVNLTIRTASNEDEAFGIAYSEIIKEKELEGYTLGFKNIVEIPNPLALCTN